MIIFCRNNNGGTEKWDSPKDWLNCALDMV